MSKTPMSKEKKEIQRYRTVRRCYPVAGEMYQEWGYLIQEHFPELWHKVKKGFLFWKKEVNEQIRVGEWRDVYSYG